MDEAHRYIDVHGHPGALRQTASDTDSTQFSQSVGPEKTISASADYAIAEGSDSSELVVSLVEHDGRSILDDWGANLKSVTALGKWLPQWRSFAIDWLELHGGHQISSSGISTTGGEQTRAGDVQQQDGCCVHQQARRYKVETFVHSSSKVNLALVLHDRHQNILSAHSGSVKHKGIC